MAKLISLPEAPEMNGKYFTGGMNQKILKRGTDADVSNQLWTTSLELTGLTDPFQVAGLGRGATVAPPRL